MQVIEIYNNYIPIVYISKYSNKDIVPYCLRTPFSCLCLAMTDALAARGPGTPPMSSKSIEGEVLISSDSI